MKVTALSCGKCGAPLTVPERTQFLTCTFCGARLEVHREGGAAFTAVLEKLADDVETVKLQNELERIDREHDAALDALGTPGEGRKLAATPRGVFVGMNVFVVLFGIVWIGTTIAIGAPFFFPLFGLAFVVLALLAARHGIRAHDRALVLKTEHQQRRAALMARLAERAPGEASGGP